MKNCNSTNMHHTKHCPLCKAKSPSPASFLGNTMIDQSHLSLVKASSIFCFSEKFLQSQTQFHLFATLHQASRDLSSLFWLNLRDHWEKLLTNHLLLNLNPQTCLQNKLQTYSLTSCSGSSAYTVLSQRDFQVCKTCFG